MQQKLLDKCYEMEQKTTNKEELKRLEVIRQMLEIPNCFVHLNINVGINVLMQLDITKEEAKKIYLKLSSFEKFKEEKAWQMKKLF